MINLDTPELITIFKNKGYKVTTQRLTICKFILSRKDHPTAETIYQELKNENPSISLGTIYKTLHVLGELGLIQELGFVNWSSRYDPNTDLHINMICVNCQQIRDFKPENLEDAWKQVISQLNTDPKGQRIDIYYECNECLKNNQN
jgi:Fur family transcriptional regulator, peroxide stress response regulator